jgi:hypothetical protein
LSGQDRLSLERFVDAGYIRGGGTAEIEQANIPKNATVHVFEAWNSMYQPYRQNMRESGVYNR